MVIARSEVDDAVRHRRRGVYLPSRTVSPQAFTRGCIQSVQMIVRRADIHDSIGHRRGGGNDIADRKLPDEIACGSIHGIQAVA